MKTAREYLLSLLQKSGGDEDVAKIVLLATPLVDLNKKLGVLQMKEIVHRLEYETSNNESCYVIASCLAQFINEA